MPDATIVPPAPALGDVAARQLRPAAAALIGALVGITWAAGLRAYMAALVGQGSVFSWSTLASILIPGAIAGACLGLAHALRDHRSRRVWLLGLAPFAFAVLTLLEPGALVALLTAGLGGGSIAVPALLVLGGFGLGTIGPRIARIACLSLALLLTVGIAATVPGVGGDRLALSAPQGVWAMVLVVGLLLTGMLGTALAFRPAVRAGR
ncbi:hypothetical protein [Agrococcus sp. KRD186]|jgi:hypothetical protein|uniref:hypothetical protein n=1 Tax=Agrococcus sp. KRD186 TaxID=2729730 RepID=UPI0019CF8F42|nr:hypothetical protein [Agrococcus sp. KRD186]